MTSCLLCTAPIKQILTFSDIFLSRLTKQTLCNACFQTFEHISAIHCDICFKPGISGTCPDCQRANKTIRHQAIFHYNDAAKHYFQIYKFQGDFRLRSAFNQVLQKTLKGHTIVPIPISKERLKTRGFNQVTGFLTSANLPYLGLLSKKESKHQSHKNRIERLSSTNPFSLNEQLPIPHRLLIFDDIYTTGTTLKHAAETIKKAGCTNISTFSLFR